MQWFVQYSREPIACQGMWQRLEGMTINKHGLPMPTVVREAKDSLLVAIEQWLKRD